MTSARIGRLRRRRPDHMKASVGLFGKERFAGSNQTVDTSPPVAEPYLGTASKSDLSHELLGADTELTLVGIAAQVEDVVGRAGFPLRLDLRSCCGKVIPLQTAPHDDLGIRLAGPAHRRA